MYLACSKALGDSGCVGSPRRQWEHMTEAWRESIASGTISTEVAPNIIGALIEAAPTSLDLTDPAGDGPLEQAADLLVGICGDSELAALDLQLAESDGPLAMRVATKLAISKQFSQTIESPQFLSVVFAVYQEHERILKRHQHPAGEDFLNRKLRQMRWLLGDSGWELIVVDDGCPDGSGAIAQDIIRQGNHESRAKVLFLQEAIDTELAVAKGLESPADSRKGGSILYGMWDALQTPRAGHVVAFTDADLSTHLGQCGLLLEPLARGAACAAGSRREVTSAVVKAGGRNDRGKLFIYLWKRMLEPLGEIVDTQCGFKGFAAEGLAEMLVGNVERKFAFDIELLLRTQLGSRGGIKKVPISWIDSEALSTTTDLQPYVPMLQAIAMMYRRYLPSDPVAGGFADLVDRLDDVSWDRLLDKIPVGITAREPLEYSAYQGVTANEIARAAQIDELA